MTMVTPSQTFKVYVKDMLRVELTRPGRTNVQAMERRLWDAAAFDSYIVGRNSEPLLDDLGLPREEAREYAAIIKAAKQEYVQGKEGR